MRHLRFFVEPHNPEGGSKDYNGNELRKGTWRRTSCSPPTPAARGTLSHAHTQLRSHARHARHARHGLGAQGAQAAGFPVGVGYALTPPTSDIYILGSGCMQFRMLTRS